MCITSEGVPKRWPKEQQWASRTKIQNPVFPGAGVCQLDHRGEITPGKAFQVTRGCTPTINWQHNFSRVHKAATAVGRAAPPVLWNLGSPSRANSSWQKKQKILPGQQHSIGVPLEHPWHQSCPCWELLLSCTGIGQAAILTKWSQLKPESCFRKCCNNLGLQKLPQSSAKHGPAPGDMLCSDPGLRAPVSGVLLPSLCAVCTDYYTVPSFCWHIFISQYSPHALAKHLTLTTTNTLTASWPELITSADTAQSLGQGLQELNRKFLINLAPYWKSPAKSHIR